MALEHYWGWRKIRDCLQADLYFFGERIHSVTQAPLKDVFALLDFFWGGALVLNT